MRRQCLTNTISASVLVCLLTASSGRSQIQPNSHQVQAGATAPIKGPGSTRLTLAPLVVAAEPAEPEEAQGETGQLFKPDPLPQSQEGSDVGLLRFSTPGAAALRLYFEQVRMPAGARMFLYGLDAEGAVTSVFGPYEASGPLADGSFRSKIIPGIEAVVELQGMDGGAWPFQIARVASIDAFTFADLRASNDASLFEMPEERKPPLRRLQRLEIDGRPRTVEMMDGLVILEGDIILGTESEVFGPGSGRKDNQRFSIARTESSGRWPGGVVPFENRIKVVMNGVSVDDARVTAALTHWQQMLDGFLSFVPRTTQSDFVVFEAAANVCQSGVGRKGGAQKIELATSCTTGNVRHEIGHAVGLQHEVAREDRNSFVRILWDNIEDGKDHNFEQRTGSANTDLGPYDFGSIMHYPFLGFSKNGKPTIEAKVDVPTGVVVGQRTSLSAGDINGVKAMYGISAGPAELYVYKEGGVFTVNVWTQADRTWSASDDGWWLGITSGSSGQGNGTIRLSIAPNDGQLVATFAATSLIGGLTPPLAPTRTANVNVALTPFSRSVSVKVIQAAGDCTMSVSPSKLTVSSLAGTYTVHVSTPSHCDWTVAESLPWVTLSPSSHGKGSGTVTVKTLTNPLVIRRSGSIVVAGKTISITQEPGECLLCDF